MQNIQARDGEMGGLMGVDAFPVSIWTLLEKLYRTC